MATMKYRVEGMTCGGCVSSVTKALERALPELKIAVVLEGGEVSVDGVHEAAAVQQAVEAAGFDFAGPM